MMPPWRNGTGSSNWRIHSVSVPSKGDFLVDDSIVFEVGGKNKDAGQIKEVENAWLALDNIETGHGRKIPLWLFGFIY